MATQTIRSYEEIEQLVNDNMALARFFVKRWPRMPEDEALSAAMHGLLYAAQHYDEARGIPFGTWASYQIRHRISGHWHKMRALKRGGGCIIFSTDAEYDGEMESSFLDSYASNDPLPDREIQIEEAKRIVKKLLPQLTPQERLIITHRFGIGTTKKTLGATAIRAGCNNRERTRQIQEIALRKLRHLHPENEFNMASK